MEAAVRVRAEAGAGETALPDFASLVREYQAMVYSVAWHFLHDRAAAEELAQDVFLQLHRGMDGFESAEHVGHWLRRVITHRCIDFSRRRKIRPQVSLDDAPEPAAVPLEGDPMLSEKLRRLVASLPEKPRAVMVLRFQEDLDPADIANVLGMPVRTVKSHIARSLVMLREKIARTLPQLAAAAGLEMDEREVGEAGHEPIG